MSKIDPSLYYSNIQTRGSTNNTLGKDDFLRILMSQLQNQDPLNPMKDKEFISQMTSFSTLEQMMNMSESIQKLTEMQTFSPIVKYSSMIGKEVSYQVIDSDTGNISDIKAGTVKAVTTKGSTVQLELDSGEKISTDLVVRVSDPEPTSTP